MTRLFSFLSVLALSLGLSAPVASAQQSQAQILSDISRQFNTVSTLSGNFVQENADGTRSSGTLLMHRPGRLRMEYAQRNGPALIVGGGSVSVFEARRSNPQVYPLSQTPLWHLLQPNTNLAQAQGVERAWEDARGYFLTLRDPQRPEAGKFTFAFTKQPFMMEGWIAESMSGEKTVVRLSSMRKGVSIGASNFSARAESDKR